MGHSIWERDEYSLRKYSPGDIDYFLDIGVCQGVTSVLFKALVPNAKVVGVEPCIEEYEFVRAMSGHWRIKCYHLALGDGNPMYFEFRHVGSHRCYTEEEAKQWQSDAIKYKVQSKTLPQLFRYFKIKGRYIIKVDCEGGERFILKDEKAIEIVRGAVQSNIEIHRGFGGSIDEWAEWFNLFKDTHKFSMAMKYMFDEKNQRIYEEVDKPKKTYRANYMLVKK